MTRDEIGKNNASEGTESETEVAADLENALARLDCHFTWGLLKGLDDIDVAHKIECIDQDVRTNEDVAPQARSLMAFLYTQLEPPDWKEATKQVELAVESSKHVVDHDEERGQGYLVVALANAAHITWLQTRATDQVDDLLKTIEALTPVGEENAKGVSGVLGAQAYALQVIDKSKHSQALELFRRAYSSDKTCYEWPMAAAIVAGRIRRLAEGPQSLPTDMEVDLLTKAVQLSNGCKAIPIVFLADVLFTLGRRYAGTSFPEDKAQIEKAKTYYLQALELAPDAIPVLKRCGKAFSVLGDAKLAEKCLRLALDLDPCNSVIMHRLGQTYEFCLSELDKARECYSQAITLEKWRNLYAELDLARVCKKQDSKYDLDRHLQEMRPHYVNDERAKQQLDAAIKRQEAHQRQWLQTKAPNSVA